MNGKLAFCTSLGGSACYLALADTISYKLSLVSYNSCVNSFVSGAHHHHHHHSN